MRKNVLGLVLLVAMVAAGCAGSAEVDSIVGSQNDGTESSQVGRTTVEATEPTAVDGPTEPAALPTPLVGDVPAPTPSESDDPEAPQQHNDDADDNPVIISPEAPLPAARLCTSNVETTEELNLRAAPSLDAPIVFGIPGGSCRMRVLGTDEAWANIVYETQTISAVGYVSADFVEEDPARTLALNWFERVVAEQDTSEVAVQELVDDSIAINPFPPAAHRVVPFAFGQAVDCKPLGGAPGISGCPVHVLDSSGDLITPMVIQTQLIAVRGGEPQVKVTGFELCSGTEDCPNFDFSLHGRIVVDESMTLAGVAIGTDAEEAIEGLKAVFAEPTEDTGWIVGCPLDGEDDVNERYVRWGSLTAGFLQGDPDPDPGRQHFFYWSYGLDQNRIADSDGPQPWEVQLPPGAGIGINISVAAADTGADLFFNEVVQAQQLRTNEWNFYGQGVETDTRINSIGVPFIPLCD